MKNMNKIMFACLMMTVGGLSAFGGSGTVGPQTFTPSDSYLQENANYKGNYFANNNTGNPAIATIHDPTLNIANGYSFSNVEVSTDQEIPGKHQLGTIPLDNNEYSFEQPIQYLHGVLVN